jgi:hypothetical protein
LSDLPNKGRRWEPNFNFGFDFFFSKRLDFCFRMVLLFIITGLLSSLYLFTLGVIVKDNCKIDFLEKY